LTEGLNGQEVLIRGRLHNSSAKGKACFVIVREQFSTVQCAMFVGENISKGMIEYARRIPKESIIDVKAIVSVPE
jgi:aspartyl/asparaginyl-tRNA synthetase